jgi:hypothetical protein
MKLDPEQGIPYWEVQGGTRTWNMPEHVQVKAYPWKQLEDPSSLQVLWQNLETRKQFRRMPKEFMEKLGLLTMKVDKESGAPFWVFPNGTSITRTMPKYLEHTTAPWKQLYDSDKKQVYWTNRSGIKQWKLPAAFAASLGIPGHRNEGDETSLPMKVDTSTGIPFWVLPDGSITKTMPEYLKKKTLPWIQVHDSKTKQVLWQNLAERKQYKTMPKAFAQSLGIPWKPMRATRKNGNVQGNKTRGNNANRITLSAPAILEQAAAESIADLDAQIRSLWEEIAIRKQTIADSSIQTQELAEKYTKYTEAEAEVQRRLKDKVQKPSFLGSMFQSKPVYQPGEEDATRRTVFTEKLVPLNGNPTSQHVQQKIQDLDTQKVQLKTAENTLNSLLQRRETLTKQRLKTAKANVQTASKLLSSSKTQTRNTMKNRLPFLPPRNL